MRILFLHNARTTFVDIDISLLTERYQLEELYIPTPRRNNPLAIMQAVHRNDLVFGWFASWHTLLPMLSARLLRTPSILVIGGYDTANVPEANYGSQRGGIRQHIAHMAIDNAFHLMTNSQAAHNEAVQNTNATSDRITIIHHGIDFIPYKENIERENMVITVGGLWHSNLLRKGLLPFVQAAAHLPDTPFVVIGKFNDDSINILREHASENVTFTGFVSDEKLRWYYQHASIYVQASLHEGFGMSVAEAMSAGCIPVTTRAGSLPEVVGETGIFTPGNNPEDIAQAIHQAFTHGDNLRLAASQRVRELFTLEARQQKLFELIENVADTYPQKLKRV